jgi:type IV secretion system protein VirD4
MSAKAARQGHWSEILPFGTLALGVSVAATQFIAWRFHYHPALGQPVFDHYYWPWSWVTWQIQYGQQGPQTFSLVNIFCLLALAAVGYSYYVMARARSRRQEKHEDVYGTAHFASEEEVRATGLLANADKSDGVYVGGWQDDQGYVHYLKHDGPEHIAAIAPTRSGKGVGLVIPSLLSWKGSAVIHDMKGELWAATAGYRKEGLHNTVLKFDPASPTGSCAFNPLEEIRLKTQFEVADVQNLVTIIVDPDGKGLNDHWAKTAHAFLIGVVLHLLYLAKHQGKPVATLTDVAMALSDPNRDIGVLYEEMRTNTHKDGKDPKDATKKMLIAHPVVASAARDMLNKPDQERGSVLSTAMSFLSLYRDGIVSQNTRRSDFRIADLMRGSKPVSLYLVVRPSDKDRLKPLMRLMLNQIVRTLTGAEIDPANNNKQKEGSHRLLLMLDEFPSFGKLEVFQEALAFIAGYGIKAYLIMQDIRQLEAAYGVNESIISNCHIRVAYAPNNPKTAEWLSKMIGQTTVVRKDTTVSGKKMGSLKNVSQTYHSSARPLMTPDEVMRLRMPDKDERTGEIKTPGEMLIFVAGRAPIRGTQILYFQDPWFSQASQITCPKKSESVREETDSEKEKNEASKVNKQAQSNVNAQTLQHRTALQIEPQQPAGSLTR